MSNTYSGTNPFAPIKTAVKTDNAAEEEVLAQEVEDAEEPQAEEVPSGTTKEILDWVGDDLDRAQRALDVEEAKGEDGLKGLKRELNKMLED